MTSLDRRQASIGTQLSVAPVQSPPAMKATVGVYRQLQKGDNETITQPRAKIWRSISTCSPYRETPPITGGKSK